MRVATLEPFDANDAHAAGGNVSSCSDPLRESAVSGTAVAEIECSRELELELLREGLGLLFDASAANRALVIARSLDTALDAEGGADRCDQHVLWTVERQLWDRDGALAPATPPDASPLDIGRDLLPSPDAAFDLALVGPFFHELRGDCRPALLELSRVIRSNGLLAVIRPSEGALPPSPGESSSPAVMRELETLLEAAGFAIERLFPIVIPRDPSFVMILSRRAHIPDERLFEAWGPAAPSSILAPEAELERFARELASFPGVTVRPVGIDIEKLVSPLDRDPDRSAIRSSLARCVCERLADFKPDDVTIDITNELSPFAAHVRAAYGCTVLELPLDLDEHSTSSRDDSGAWPHLSRPDNSCTKMILRCSFERLPGDADKGFIREAARVLRSNGRLLIGPLNLARSYLLDYAAGSGGHAAAHTSSAQSAFRRTYDVHRLCTRVLAPAREFFDIVVYHLKQLEDLRLRLPAKTEHEECFYLSLTRRPRDWQPPTGRATRQAFTRDVFALLPRTLFGGGLAAEAGTQQATKKLLIVHDRVPEHDSSGADFRLLRVLEALREQGHAITFLGRNGENAQRYRETLDRLGIKVIPGDPAKMAWYVDVELPRVDLRALLQSGGFDAAILCNWFWSSISAVEQYLPEIRQHAPGLPVVVLTDDVHWYRELLRSRVTGRRLHAEVSRCLRLKELEIYRQADLVLTITEEDAARLREDIPGAKVAVLHHTFGELPEVGPPYEARSTLLFIGSGLNEANERAVTWLAEEILPEIHRSLPGVPLHVVGEPPLSGWKNSHSLPSLVSAGRVPDLTPAFAAARVFLSPIPYGTGLKTKNVLAMAHGIPLVTTRVGAEGMFLDERVACVTDDARAMARAAVELYTDRSLWEERAARSREHVRTYFGMQRLRDDLRAILKRTEGLRPAPGGASLTAASTYVESVFPDRCFMPQPQRVIQRANAHIELAKRLLTQARPDEAAHELRHILCEHQYNPDWPALAVVYSGLAKIYLAKGEADEAIASLKEALRLRPELEQERLLLHRLEQ
ncbi:MAG: glycosyltransferase [Planctomycetota bacterium]